MTPPLSTIRDPLDPYLGSTLAVTGTVRSYCDVVRDIRVNGHPVPAGDIQFLSHPVSEFASTNDLETVAWGMEPPYDVTFSMALDSFSASAVVVEAYGTVSGHPGRLRVPVVFPAGATNGVAGVCGESSVSPAWSTRSFYEFYRQDAGWDFLYKFEVDHAGAGAAILDVADGLRCVAQGADSALYRLERPLVFLPAPVESTATSPGAASLRGPGLVFLDPADAPVIGTYAPEEEGPIPAPVPLRTRGVRNDAQSPTPSGNAATASSDTLFPVSLIFSSNGYELFGSDEWDRGGFSSVSQPASFRYVYPFNMENLPDDAVLVLEKTFDPETILPTFSVPCSISRDSQEGYIFLNPQAAGVVEFELRLLGTGVSSKDRIRVTFVDVDIDVDSTADGSITPEDEEWEETRGGVCAVDGSLRHILLSVKGPQSGGTVRLSAEEGASKIRLWLSFSQNEPVDLPAEWNLTELPPILQVEGVDFSESLCNVKLLLEYRAPGMDAYIEDSAFSDAIRMTVLKIDLDVDTDRNGIVDDSDEQGEDRWHNSRGAFSNVNFDRDGTRTIHGEPRPDAIHFDDSGNAVDEDYFIENDIDALDIAPLVIRRIRPVVPQGYSVYLKTADIQDVQRIHVYKAIRSPNAVEGDANEAIWGSMTRPETRSEIDITRWVNPSLNNTDFQGDSSTGDSTFGIEGLSFRNMGSGVDGPHQFDGYINLSLDLRNGCGDILASDTVCMKVAPWITFPPQSSGQTVYVRNCEGDNEAFRLSAKADPGYFGLDRSGVMQTILERQNDRSQWLQDHVEIGFTQRPGEPVQHMAFRLPYYRRDSPVNPIWPVSDFLGRDYGVFQIGRDARDSGLYNVENVCKGYGGNLETTPPSEQYPLGRIVLGDINLVPKRLIAFLRSQEVQMSALSIPVGWLLVGHVDEAVSFLEDGRIAIVSPRRALELLEAIPEPLRLQCVFFAKGVTPETGITSANSSVNKRVETGLDLRGSPWKYVRIVSGPDAGTVGEINSLDDGFLTVSNVWHTTSQLVNGTEPEYDYSYWATKPQNGPLLDSWVPRAGEQYVLCEDSLRWNCGMPAIITVKELLEDSGFVELNMRFENSEIHDIRTRLEAEIPMGEFVEMPGLFLAILQGHPSSATIKNAYAFNPNPVNMQIVNGDFYIPRQFGPVRNGPRDVFENEILEKLGVFSFFVDDWNVYHALNGEVHCGSAVKRSHPAMPWWESLQ